MKLKRLFVTQAGCWYLTLQKINLYRTVNFCMLDVAESIYLQITATFENIYAKMQHYDQFLGQHNNENFKFGPLPKGMPVLTINHSRPGPCY
jgi:hypothetical protein